MGRQKKILFLVLAAIVVIGVASYFFSGSRQIRKIDVSDLNITIGAETSVLPAAIWIAADQKFFQKEGLNVKIRPFDSGRASFQAMLDGEVVISTVAPTPIMFTSFKRDDFAIFATIAYADDDIKVIARADKGIRIPADLEGKRVGTPKGTTGQFFLNSFLVFNELTSAGVSEVFIKPSDLPGALESGDVDAIVIWEPHANNAKKLLKDKALRLPSSEVYRTTFNLMAMKPFIKDHPQVLERFLRAVDKATIFLLTQKDKSKDILSRRFQLSKTEMAEIWDNFVFEISLDQSLMVTLEDEAQWAIDKGLTRGRAVPNYLDFIYAEALRRVKPMAVTLGH